MYFGTGDVLENNNDTLEYIFLGHVYRYNYSNPGYRVDPRVEGINYINYDRVWLGGDVCSEAMLDRATIGYIDSVFDLGNPTTQYALGNHDIRNGNIQYYREYTGRKSYNVCSSNGAVSICINSQISPTQCEDLNNQFDLIKNVCDTIQESSFLFLLMHSCIFTGVPNIPSSNSFAHADFGRWNANCSGSSATFVSAIYPMLVQVRDRGIEVFCIMGDAGSNDKEYYMAASDSIHFFASGICNSKFEDPIELAQQPKDKVLVFQHTLGNQEIKWEFQDLDSLFNAQ